MIQILPPVLQRIRIPIRQQRVPESGSDAKQQEKEREEDTAGFRR